MFLSHLFRVIIILLTIVLLSAPNFIDSPKGSRQAAPSPNDKITAKNFYKESAQNISTGNEAKSLQKISKNNHTKKQLNAIKNSSNYFHIDESGETLWNGKYWSSNLFPLKVYVQKSHSSHFKKIYHKYIDYAFLVWGNADERIKFKYVQYPDEANIIINFDENLMEKYNQNFLGITEYELNSDKSINVSFVHIGLLNFEDKKISNGEIKATIVHELGHALGLGHSSNDLDVMFPFINPNAGNDMDYSDLSHGDISAVKSVLNLSDEKKYSAER